MDVGHAVLAAGVISRELTDLVANAECLEFFGGDVRVGRLVDWECPDPGGRIGREQEVLGCELSGEVIMERKGAPRKGAPGVVRSAVRLN